MEKNNFQIQILYSFPTLIIIDANNLDISA